MIKHYYRLSFWVLLLLLLNSCESPGTQPTLTTTMVPPTPTYTPIPTHTPTPIPLYDLEGSMFFDYNGNGVWDESEPPIVGFRICAKPKDADEICVDIDKNGGYQFEGLAPENTQVTVSFTDPNADVLELAFRYLSLSVEEFQPITEQLTVEMKGDTSKEWGLMHGFLTLPFGLDTRFTRESPFGYASVFDLDPRVGFTRGYNPDFLSNWEAKKAPWIMDNHIGVDFCIPEMTPLLAAMPGTITYVGEDDYGGLGIWICYDEWANYYNHNSEILVEVGDTVYRGQVIALSGNTGQSGEPHLHFSFTT